MSHSLSNHKLTAVLSSLIDGGANGGTDGNDVTVLSESSFNNVNVTGIGESLIQNLPLASVARLVNTQRGLAVVIMNQYVNFGKGHTIHFASQVCAFGTLVHEAPTAMVASNVSSLQMDTKFLSPTVLGYPIWICAPQVRPRWILCLTSFSLAMTFGTLLASLMNFLFMPSSLICLLIMATKILMSMTLVSVY